MVLGKSRQAHQRTIMHSNTRQAANNHALEHSTGSERVDAFGLREMVLGKSRQAHQRTQSLPSATHRHSSITRPCCSSAQAPSFLSFTRAHQRTIMHSNTRQALNASTRSVYAKCYWVNHGRLTSERQAHQRMQSLPSATHRHSSITRPCCSSAQAPSFLSFTRAHQRTIMHSNTRQALNASTRSVYAKCYWVNHGRLTSERQAHQRMQSLPSATHRHSSITRPCCSSAQAPSFLSFTRRRRVRDAPSR